MSTMYPVIEIEFKNRKPSKAVIMRTVGEYLKEGGRAFIISWGENSIDLNWHEGHKHWYGEGWIKDISGQDIGNELNDIRKFVLDHFQYIHVGDRHD